MRIYLQKVKYIECIKMYINDRNTEKMQKMQNEICPIEFCVAEVKFLLRRISN